MDKIKNHAKLLAEMVPPRSNPAGSRMLTNGMASTNDLQDNVRSAWIKPRPKVPKTQYGRWLHGDYKDAPPFLTHELYRMFKGNLDDDTLKGRPSGGSDVHVLED